MTKISSIQFDGTPECAMKISDAFKMEYDKCQFDESRLIVYTPEGNIIANKGDWIIKNSKGEVLVHG